jgi:two-component system, chemotaxis family, protein-glutamate methylesterase/glutaminase
LDWKNLAAIMYPENVNARGQPIGQRAAARPLAAKFEVPQSRETSPEAVPIVCIGLSAGGLKPLETIFKQLSPATGMAFVVVSHLNLEHPTELPWLLSQWSLMPAQEARACLSLEPNHIYVILPGSELKLDDGYFYLGPRSQPRGLSNVITLFLESMTRWRTPPGVVIILSGLYGDGSSALQQFQRQGGITIAQDLNTADYGEMPRSAINTGSVDYILTPEAIARKVAEISKDIRPSAFSDQLSDFEAARAGYSFWLTADRWRVIARGHFFRLRV